MDPNVGGIDRTARIALGAVAVLAGAVAFAGFPAVGGSLAAVGLAVGAVLLTTGTARRCPLNEAAGIDTTE